MYTNNSMKQHQIRPSGDAKDYTVEVDSTLEIRCKISNQFELFVYIFVQMNAHRQRKYLRLFMVLSTYSSSVHFCVDYFKPVKKIND